MTTKVLIISLACFGMVACAQRTASIEEEPTVEDICNDWCAAHEPCLDIYPYPYPYPTREACVDDCTTLYYAWPYDPEGRFECADAILELQRCIGQLETCEEVATVGGHETASCHEYVLNVSNNGCNGGHDPRDYVDTGDTDTET